MMANDMIYNIRKNMIFYHSEILDSFKSEFYTYFYNRIHDIVDTDMKRVTRG